MKTLILVPVLLLLSGPAAAQEADRGEKPLVAVVQPAEPDEAEAARAVVESLHEVILGCMQNADELGFEGRSELIAANLGESFDLPFMARTAVGPTWKELTPEQRAAFVDLSRRLSAARYADNFDGYEGQHFETRSERPAARKTLLVRTKMIQPKGRDVGFDYRLRKVGSEWRIIDVLLDGTVSELVLWRGQYRSVIEGEGFEALMAAMESKIEQHSVE